MNNTYNSNGSLHQQQPQHQHQNAQQQVQSIAYLPAHAHIQTQAHRHLNATNDDNLSSTGTTTYYDARTLEKTYANYANATGRYFTAPHNTILITNNFAQQNVNAAANNFNNNNNIRILSAPATNDAAGTLQLSHGHLFHTQQTPHQHFTTHTCQPHFATLATQQQQQQQQQPHATMHFANLPVTTTTAAAATTNAQTPTHYFLHGTDATLAHVESGSKLLPALVAAGTPTMTKTTATANNNSTVVLDRINICINNHYNDATTNNIDVPLSCATTTTTTTVEEKEQQQQQPSPVIPAIQHKTTLLHDNVATLLNAARIAQMESNQTVHVVDEPDSTTTTSQTPPTTPNTITMEAIINSPTHQSPSTTTSTITATIPINELQLLTNNLNNNLNKQKSFQDIANKTTITPTTTIVIDCEEDDDNDDDEDDVEDEELEDDIEEEEDERVDVVEATEQNTATNDDEDEEEEEEDDDEDEIEEASDDKIQNEVEEVELSKNSHNFKIGEDVLLKRLDNRFYLGTVIGIVSQQYLVRFDDQSEQWCVADEMRKLGGGGILENSTNSTLNNHKNGENLITESCTQMCVVCKIQQPNDVVECCERCGRGYHRGCTSEVSPGSGEWFCKR